MADLKRISCRTAAQERDIERRQKADANNLKICENCSPAAGVVAGLSP
jgi:hypothetical protein